GPAELANRPIPTANGVATVLHESRQDTRLAAEDLQLLEADVADAQEPHAAAVMDPLHRPPGSPIGRTQSISLIGTVQHIGIDTVDSQMLKRAGERLADLCGD